MNAKDVLTVRVAYSLKKALKARAKAEHRTLSNFVEILLAAAMSSDFKLIKDESKGQAA